MFDSLLSKYPEANGYPLLSNSLSYLKRVFFAESRHRSRANSSRGQLVSSSYLLLFFFVLACVCGSKFPFNFIYSQHLVRPAAAGWATPLHRSSFFYYLTVSFVRSEVFVRRFYARAFFGKLFFTRIVLRNKFCCNPLTLLIVRIERPIRGQIIHSIVETQYSIIQIVSLIDKSQNIYVNSEQLCSIFYFDLLL